MLVPFNMPVTVVITHCLSQCCKHDSAYTFVRATSLAYRLIQIRGCQNPQTTESTDIKYVVDDYVGDIAMHAKMQKDHPSGGILIYGWNVILVHFLVFNFGWKFCLHLATKLQNWFVWCHFQNIAFLEGQICRKSIRPVKNWVLGCWHGYLSVARCRFAYGPADATATLCLLSVKSRLVLVPAHPGNPK